MANEIALDSFRRVAFDLINGPKLFLKYSSVELPFVKDTIVHEQLQISPNHISTHIRKIPLKGKLKNLVRAFIANQDLAQHVWNTQDAVRVYHQYLLDSGEDPIPSYGLNAPIYRQIMEANEIHNPSILVAGVECPHTLAEVIQFTKKYGATIEVADISQSILKMVQERHDVAVNEANFLNSDCLSKDYDYVFCDNIFSTFVPSHATVSRDMLAVMHNFASHSEATIFTQRVHIMDYEEERVRTIERYLQDYQVLTHGSALQFNERPTLDQLSANKYNNVHQSQEGFYLVIGK